jgi:hypothetical protein
VRSQVPNAHKCPTLTSAQRSQVPNAHKCPTLTSAQRSQVPNAHKCPRQCCQQPTAAYPRRLGAYALVGSTHATACPSDACPSAYNTATAYLLCLVLNRVVFEDATNYRAQIRRLRLRVGYRVVLSAAVYAACVSTVLPLLHVYPQYYPYCMCIHSTTLTARVSTVLPLPASEGPSAPESLAARAD